MKTNIICIDLTKFNNEKLIEVAKQLNLDMDILLGNKGKGFAKLFLDGSRLIAFTAKKDKDNIIFLNSFSDKLKEMDSFSPTKKSKNLDIDSKLEKISKYGVESLSKVEKGFLDNLN